MRELSLHILDVAENAITACAQRINLTIVEDLETDRLVITVVDDGRGMDAETVHRVREPFFSTRTTRHIGLGIPLFAAAAERCAGELIIDSTPGVGTRIEAVFQRSHIDRAPLGDIPGTLICILMRAQDLDMHYQHRVLEQGSERAFDLDTVEIKRELGGVPLSHPDVREWLRAFIAQEEEQLKET
jgi:anti-sigma regulatory factor (Ser/Thr protein kinase)